MEENDSKKQEGEERKEKKEKKAKATVEVRLYEGTAERFLKEKKADENVAVWVPKKTLSYEAELKKLQVELTKLQQDMKKRGTRVLAIFEGRDAAGKGGTISRITAFLNPRNARIVALPAPSDKEVTQWYFQRYVPHLPAAGELVLFDRSWYNRAMVEPVMGFCSEEQHHRFLEDVPLFEQMLVKDGIHLFKFYFSVSRKEQARRFEARKTDILKQYKLSPVDNLAQKYWDQYTIKKFEMLSESNRAMTPWTIIRSDNKKMARINCIKFLLSHLDYDKKIGDKELMPDPDIVISGSDEIKHMEKNLLDPKHLRG